jgi:hypothetical protein
MQVALPTLGWYVPAGHGFWLVAPGAATKFPALAFEHFEDLVATANVPTAHSVCSICPAFDT